MTHFPINATHGHGVKFVATFFVPRLDHPLPAPLFLAPPHNMSHKGKNSAAAGKGKKPKTGGESKSEDVLQAVVGCDGGAAVFLLFAVSATLAKHFS